MDTDEFEEVTGTTYVSCPSHWPTVLFAATGALLAGMWIGRDRYRAGVIRALEEAQTNNARSILL